jgi:hypothetical protein
VRFAYCEASSRSYSGSSRATRRRKKTAAYGASVTSDAGLLAFRELDDALGLTHLAADLLHDPRTAKNGRHTLLAQFRQAVFGQLVGYEDVNDADRLGRDPAMRWVSGACGDRPRRVYERDGPLRDGRDDRGEEPDGPGDLSGRWIDRVQVQRARRALVLDIDSSVSPTYGAQERTTYSGRDPPAGQPSAPGADRAAAHATCRPPTALRAALLRELSLSGAELGPGAPGGGEGRVVRRELYRVSASS